MSLRLPPFPTPPPNSVTSALPPYCTALCTCMVHLGTARAPACCTGGFVGGGGCPPPVLPRHPGIFDTRSAPAWLYASPPGHYTPQLGRALALNLSETPSCTSCSCRPRLIRHPPVPDPPSPRRAGFGNTQPVTPSQIPSSNQGSWPVPAFSPCNSFLPPSSSGYRLCLPVSWPPGMYGRPSPRFFGHSSSAPPGQRVPP